MYQAAFEIFSIASFTVWIIIAYYFYDPNEKIGWYHITLFLLVLITLILVGYQILHGKF